MSRSWAGRSCRPALGRFVPAGARPVKLISFYRWRRETGSPSPLHIPVLALGLFLLLPAAGRPLVLIGDRKVPRQQESGVLGADPVQMENKVDHIPVCLTAETAEALVVGFQYSIFT